MRRARTLLVALGALLVAAPGRAQPPDPAPTVTLAPSATGLWIGGVAGGVRTGGVLNTLGVLGWSADLERATRGNWSGAELGGSLLWIRGRSVSDEFVGDALVVSNVDGYDAIRLFTAWVQQSWGPSGSVRLGILAADEEFAGNEFGGALTNSVFGWPAFVAFNAVHGGPIFSVGAPGIRIESTPAPGWVVRGGAYDGDALDDPEGRPTTARHGLHWQLTAEQGAFVAAEVGHQAARGPARIVKLGGWWHSGRFTDVRHDGNGVPFAVSGGEPREHHGNGGLWLVGAGDLLRVARIGEGSVISGWARLGGSPGDRNEVSWGGDAGLQWTGPVPGRASDALVLGVGHVSVSRAVIEAARDAQHVAGTHELLPDFERVVEVTYRAQLHPRLSVAPGVQWIQHPGLSGALANAWVPSLRATLQ